MKPWITLIIPVYNVEKYIGQCLDSIVIDNKDTLSQIEVIIVDDGSPDLSGQIADEYALKYSRVRVVHQENAGVATARNTALQEALGEWIYFVDSDDWLEAGALEIMCNKSRELAEADMILWDAWQNTGDRQTVWEHFEEEAVWDSEDELRELQAGVLYFPIMFEKTCVPLAAPWDKLYRRDFLREHSLQFRKQLKVLDDMVFNFECFRVAGKVAYCKKRIYHYRYVPNSITNSYKPDRIEQDSAVWSFLKSYLLNEEQREILEQAYYCRIVKSFSICCRLCFFHRKNEKSTRDKLCYVREMLDMDEYKNAFRSVKISNVEWKLKIVILFVRWKWIGGIYLLHLLQNGWK